MLEENKKNTVAFYRMAYGEYSVNIDKVSRVLEISSGKL